MTWRGSPSLARAWAVDFGRFWVAEATRSRGALSLVVLKRPGRGARRTWSWSWNCMPDPTLRLGTRGSLLARTQSMLVADALERAHLGLKIEMHIVKTTGDQITDRPLHEAGGKGLFTKELEQALLAGEIDFAVHSYKDVPVTMPLVDQADLVIAAVPTREDPRDVLVSRKAKRLADLPPGARVGTGSLRRACQIVHARPDVVIEPVRGNIDTRLRKLTEGHYDAI